MAGTGLSRRNFLAASPFLLGLGALSNQSRLRADDGRPPVTRPRAIAGDERVQPAWDELLTVTVGPRDADLVGTSQKVIQAAVDYVAKLGGGTVHLQPGSYSLRAAVKLPSNIRLRGSGPDTLLTKPASITTKLAEDSDWYDQEITLADAAGFQVGDDICLKSHPDHLKIPQILKRTLVARSGNRFKLDRALRENVWQLGQATCSSLYPLVTAEFQHNIAIENLALDGNRANNELLDGNYAGCVFLQDCRDVILRDVIARNYHGDGLSWQICHDVTVENCTSQGHSGLGLHPGSGSQRPLIRHNRLIDNDIGIFFCWGVKFGLAEDNLCTGNRVGISIGHRDTDNLIRRNRIENSGLNGILFRPERGPTFCAHRNRLEDNTILNSGNEQGVAIDIQGGTEEVTFLRNKLQETRHPAQRIGFRLGAETRQIQLTDNAITGFAKEVVELPKT